MKALSIKQPYANKIANGDKTIEVRTWFTGYRGRLLIASSKKPDIYPAGYVIAVATLVDVRKMTIDDQDEALCPCVSGDVAFVLRNVRRVKPIPIKGKLSIFHTDIQEEDLEYLDEDIQPLPCW